MISLADILREHAPILLLDAGSARIQVGLIEGAGVRVSKPWEPDLGVKDPALSAQWAESGEEAGVGLFRCVESLKVDIGQVRGFAFAEGPGSVLGIRTAAMALRTWCALAPRPVYAYHGLDLLARADGRAGVTFIADARRDTWHCCRVGEAVRRVPTAELRVPLAMPEGFRHWTPLPSGVEQVPYSLADLLARTVAVPLFHLTDAPDAFLHQEPQYAAWAPQIHRAP